MNMELLSSQGLFKSSQYAAMNDLLFQQFGFQVLANNIHEENTDTYPILVQSVLRESDVEIWGGFCVRAYIVKLDFQKTPGQPKMCLAILLKNKYTPDVKRLEAPFKLQAFHLQWIQNVLDEDLDDMPVGNSKEIPFIAMYDAVELSKMERTAQDIKTCEEMDKIQENITVGNFGQQDCAVEETEYIGDLNQSAVRETLHELSFTLTRNPKSWKDQSSGNAMLINAGGQLTVEEEMESTNTGDQSAVRQTSCDLLLTQSSKIYQEVSVDTVDMNNQLKLEWFQTNLKEATKTERTEELNEEAPRDTSHEDGNLEPTTYKTEDYESSEKFAKLPNTEADFENANIELSTKESNLEMNHSECDSKSKAAITDMLDAAAETTEVPSTDTDGANSTDESYHPEVESDSDEDFLPEAKSKKKRSAKKIATSQEKKLQFEDCGKAFQVEKKHSLHMEWHKKKEENQELKPERQVKRRIRKKVHQCGDCNASFSVKLEYSRHVRTHQQDAGKMHKRTYWNRLECRVCGTKLKKRAEKKEHMSSEHPEERPYTCEVCSSSFKELRNLKRHRKAVHDTVYKCEDCGINFNSKREYSSHVKRHEADSRQGSIKCCVCGTQFEKVTELKGHVSSEHPGEFPYICEACGSCFRNFGDFARHSQEEHNFTYHKCDECVKAFKTAVGLTMHKQTKHSSGWKYQCDICGRKILTKPQYKSHMLVHSTERNFQCEVCGKAFKIKRDLTRHLNIHLGKKPYLCEVCGKGFGRKEHLKEHEVVHTKLNTFLCDYCGKSFSNKTNLYVHRRQHTGVRPVVCKICGQGFHRQKGLAKHTEKMHPSSTTEFNTSDDNILQNLEIFAQ